MSRVTAPLIFMDTETTGLHKARRPWEIALIKRSDTGQTRLLLCVDVGVVTRFDTECLADMFARHGMKPAWQDDLVDVVPLAIAAFRAAGREPASDVASLSRQCGVKPPTAAQRHTALGDARWAMRWYDKLAQI
jgi:hypothetical protein